MSRQETRIIPREYTATVRESAREYTATVSDGFVETPPTRTIDDFEDGDVAEYVDPNNILSAQQSVVYEGDWAGKIDAPSPATAISESGLDNYPTRGDEFRYWHRVDSGGNVVMLFGIVDALNCYIVQFDSAGTAGLLKLSEGSIQVLDFATVPSPSEFNKVVVDFDSAGNGTIAVDIDDSAATLSAQDAEHDGADFGWGGDGGAVGYVDGAEII